jgi:hypothetical protein
MGIPMYVEYTNFFISRSSKVYPNLDFWFENISSGNPALRISPKTLQKIYTHVINFCLSDSRAGLPDGFFQAKNRNLGTFWRVEVYLWTFWSILLPSDIFYGHLVYLVVIWYIFSRFVPRQIWQP